MTTHVKATSRYVRVAPNKARQVVAHIRGRRIDDARRMLLLSPKAISEQILKTLNSAVANAENNHELDAEDLYVTAVIVDEGPQLKRFQPRAMGRAYRIRKRTSHITISVSTENAPPPRVNRNRPAPAVVAAPEPVEEVAKKPSRRGKAEAPAAKATAKKATAKKSTAKKATAKKSTAKKATEEPTTEADETPVADTPDETTTADTAADTTDEARTADTADATADDTADAAIEDDDDAADADTKE